MFRFKKDLMVDIIGAGSLLGVKALKLKGLEKEGPPLLEVLG